MSESTPRSSKPIAGSGGVAVHNRSSSWAWVCDWGWRAEAVAKQRTENNARVLLRVGHRNELRVVQGTECANGVVQRFLRCEVELLARTKS